MGEGGGSRSKLRVEKEGGPKRGGVGPTRKRKEEPASPNSFAHVAKRKPSLKNC